MSYSDRNKDDQERLIRVHNLFQFQEIISILVDSNLITREEFTQRMKQRIEGSKLDEETRDDLLEMSHCKKSR